MTVQQSLSPSLKGVVFALAIWTSTVVRCVEQGDWRLRTMWWSRSNKPVYGYVLGAGRHPGQWSAKVAFRRPLQVQPLGCRATCHSLLGGLNRCQPCTPLRSARYASMASTVTTELREMVRIRGCGSRSTRKVSPSYLGEQKSIKGGRTCPCSRPQRLDAADDKLEATLRRGCGLTRRGAQGWTVVMCEIVSRRSWLEAPEYGEGAATVTVVACRVGKSRPGNVFDDPSLPVAPLCGQTLQPVIRSPKRSRSDFKFED
ncbi:hypothetical protein KCU88_g415, partial [Aureobasidium melanogenum]